MVFGSGTECGSILPSKEQGQERYWRVRLKESKKEYKVRDRQESPKMNPDTDCNAQIMRRAYNAGKSGNWESFKEEFRKKSASSVNRRLKDFKKRTTRLLRWTSVAQEILN